MPAIADLARKARLKIIYLLVGLSAGSGVLVLGQVCPSLGQCGSCGACLAKLPLLAIPLTPLLLSGVAAAFGRRRGSASHAVTGRCLADSRFRDLAQHE